MCTKLPSLNNAIAGEDGGKGIINSLAFPTASVSTPAKTVTKLFGTFSACNEATVPGLQVPAAQPQTELTTTKVVPSFFNISSTFEIQSSVRVAAFCFSSTL